MIYKNTKELFNGLNLDLTSEQHHKFCDYEELLLEWNKKINLTSITDDHDIWIKHFVDSCTISKYIKENDCIIDVGTGAGFPSLPLKIINPKIKLTLLDSLNKRINFLRTICEQLMLENVDFVHGRAEDIAQNCEYREKYDVATARAVANMSTLCEYCLPFVKKGGIFICMKAGNCKEEIDSAKNAIKKLGGIIEKIEYFTLPNSDFDRTIIIIKKLDSTPKLYPRTAGIPSKKPL